MKILGKGLAFGFVSMGGGLMERGAGLDGRVRDSRLWIEYNVDDGDGEITCEDVSVVPL